MQAKCQYCENRTPECHAKCIDYLMFELENERIKDKRHEQVQYDRFSFESVMRSVYDKNNIHHADYGYCVRTKRKRGLT